MRVETNFHGRFVRGWSSPLLIYGILHVYRIIKIFHVFNSSRNWKVFASSNFLWKISNVFVNGRVSKRDSSVSSRKYRSSCFQDFPLSGILKKRKKNEKEIVFLSNHTVRLYIARSFNCYKRIGKKLREKGVKKGESEINGSSRV